MLMKIPAIFPGKLRSVASRVRARLMDSYATQSYSQEGEDMVLHRIFEDRDHGFYVDVGAHHPSRFSNTCFFYRRGWRGINIEPNPEAISLFMKERKRDINLQLGVSNVEGRLTYYKFDEPALNTFDPDIVNLRLADTSYKLLTTCKIKVERLDQILSTNLPVDTAIDFLSIDVEGLDLQVLTSNDWKRFRPRYVLAEALKTTLEDAIHSDICSYMKEQKYVLFAKTYNTLFFKDSQGL